MPIPISPDQLRLVQLPIVWSAEPIAGDPPGGVIGLESAARAGLLLKISAPEAALRLFLGELEVERVTEAPKGYDSAQQGEWDPRAVTYRFTRLIRMMRIEKKPNRLTVEFHLGDLGYWTVTIEADAVNIARV
jgi:hypothetical protein